jgi:hypothetical protein
MLTAAGSRVAANLSHSTRMLSLLDRMKSASRMGCPDKQIFSDGQDVGLLSGRRVIDQRPLWQLRNTLVMAYASQKRPLVLGWRREALHSGFLRDER